MAAVIALVAIAVLVVLWWSSAGPLVVDDEDYELPTTFTEGEIPPAPIIDGERDEERSLSPDGGPRRAPTHDEDERAAALESGVPFDTETLPPTIVDPGPGEYLRFYGGRSGAMSPHARPSWANVTTQMRSLNPEAPRLVVWTPTIRIQSGQSVQVFALLRTPDGREDAERITLTVWDQGEQATPRVTSMTRVPGDDESPHDYTATFTANADDWPDPGNGRPVELNWRVRAEGMLDGAAYARDAGGVLSIHSPSGMLQADTIEVAKTSEGFVLRVDAVIEEQGSYWAYAEAWGGDEGDRPIAFGRIRRESLDPGTHTFELLFGGAIIADRGIDGPYAIRNLRFMRVDAVPPQEQEPIDPAATTPPWSASGFQ